MIAIVIDTSKIMHEEDIEVDDDGGPANQSCVRDSITWMTNFLKTDHWWITFTIVTTIILLLLYEDEDDARCKVQSL